LARRNQRLLSIDGHSVRFRWKGYAHGNKQRIMALTATEFLRAFAKMCCPVALFVYATSAISPANQIRSTLSHLQMFLTACRSAPCRPKIDLICSGLFIWR
jgi:hypothetical protein